MPDLTPFSGAIGAIAGATIALVGTWLTWRHQFNMEILKDRQALRNARRERLRQTYEVVLLTAVTMRQAAARLIVLFGDETAESRGKELNELFEKVTADLDHARVRLLLEQGTDLVYAQFEKLRLQFIEYQQLETDKRSGDRSIRATDLGERRRQIEADVELLRAAMHESLNSLDEPVTDVRLAERSRRRVLPPIKRWLRRN